MNKTTSRDGTTLAFDRTGDGPPVIIVEGAFCDRRTSAPLAERLAATHTVFAYDRRGKGDSGDTLPWSIDREIEDLTAILTEAGGSAGVYGMSSGAVLALEAVACGAAITRLAMYEPPVSPDGNRARTGDMVGDLTALISAGRHGDAVEHFMTVGVRIPAEVVAQIRQSPMWAGLEAIAHTLVYDNTITSDPTVLTRGRCVEVPTLVLGGTDSPAFLRDSVRTVADAIPVAEHRFLDGLTHEVDPAVLAPVLAEFFR